MFLQLTQSNSPHRSQEFRIRERQRPRSGPPSAKNRSATRSPPASSVQIPRNPTREAGSNLNVPDACVDKNPFFFEFPVDKRLSVVQDDSEKIITKLESKFDQIFLDAFGEYGAPEEVTNTFFYKTELLPESRRMACWEFMDDYR